VAASAALPESEIFVAPADFAALPCRTGWSSSLRTDLAVAWAVQELLPRAVRPRLVVLALLVPPMVLPMPTDRALSDPEQPRRLERRVEPPPVVLPMPALARLVVPVALLVVDPMLVLAWLVVPAAVPVELPMLVPALQAVAVYPKPVAVVLVPRAVPRLAAPVLVPVWEECLLASILLACHLHPGCRRKVCPYRRRRG
jgi:hypothetical protein